MHSYGNLTSMDFSFLCTINNVYYLNIVDLEFGFTIIVVEWDPEGLSMLSLCLCGYTLLLLKGFECKFFQSKYDDGASTLAIHFVEINITHYEYPK